MINFRQILFALALLITLVSLGRAQSTSTIADNVKNVDGSPFNGTVVITWTGASTPTGSNPLPYSTSVKIYNGVLSVSLVPTVAYSAFYLAVFNSSDGKTSWVENWQVGPSTSPLTLSQVRAPLSTDPPPSGTTTLSIAQVTGLNSYLNALSTSVGTVTSTIGNYNSTVSGLNNAVSNLTDRVNTLQILAANPTSGTVIEGETPSGNIDGANSSFTIATTPTVASSLMVFRNGILQSPSFDYSFLNKTVTFASGSLPQTGDRLQVSYRIGTPAQSSAFVDNETPQGTADGVNLTFRLAGSPTSNTLRLYKNGALLQANSDYAVSGATVTFTSALVTPGAGDKLTAYYRLTTQNP